VLDLAENKISDSGAEALANNNILFNLNLAGNNIKDPGAIALANNTRLISLNVCNDPIGSIGATALKNNTILNSLYMTENHICQNVLSKTSAMSLEMAVKLKNNTANYKEMEYALQKLHLPH